MSKTVKQPRTERSELAEEREINGTTDEFFSEVGELSNEDDEITDDIEGGREGDLNPNDFGFFHDPITLGLCLSSPSWIQNEMRATVVGLGDAKLTVSAHASKIVMSLEDAHKLAFSRLSAGNGSDPRASDFLMSRYAGLTDAGVISHAKKMLGPSSTPFAPFEVVARRPGTYAVFARSAGGKSTFVTALAAYMEDRGKPYEYKVLSEPEDMLFVGMPHVRLDGTTRKNDLNVPVMPRVLTLPSLYTGMNLKSTFSKEQEAWIATGDGRRTLDPNLINPAASTAESLFYLPELNDEDGDEGEAVAVRKVIILDSIKDFLTMPGFSQTTGSGGFPLQLLRALSVWNAICQMSGVSLIVVANPIALKDEFAETYEESLRGSVRGLFSLSQVTSDGDFYGPEGTFRARKYESREATSFKIRGAQRRLSTDESSESIEVYVPKWDMCSTSGGAKGARSSESNFRPLTQM